MSLGEEPAAAGAPELPLTGGCGCGAVRFALSAPLLGAGYCHCTRCQRRTGTAASANGALGPRLREASPRARIASELGRPRVASRRFSAATAARRCSHAQPEGELAGVRLGSIDGDPGVRPAWRQFVAYAAPWEPIPDDGLPRYPERRVAD